MGPSGGLGAHCWGTKQLTPYPSTSHLKVRGDKGVREMNEDDGEELR